MCLVENQVKTTLIAVPSSLLPPQISLGENIEGRKQTGLRNFISIGTHAK